MTTLSARISGIGLLGPGLCGWSAAAPVLAGVQPYRPAATLIPAPERLAAAERRRTGRVARLALAAGFEAVAAAAVDPGTLPAVFASSGGDGENCHAICEVLAGGDRALSPTRFHNSVHNAPSGYWSIAAGSMAPANIVCAYDASFAAGLLEALVYAAFATGPVLLIAYDADYPPPMRVKRPIPDAFAVALVLDGRTQAQALAQLSATLVTPASNAGARAATTSALPALQQLQSQIPAARSLPLLHALACRSAATLTLEYLQPLQLQLQVQPC